MNLCMCHFCDVTMNKAEDMGSSDPAEDGTAHEPRYWKQSANDSPPASSGYMQNVPSSGRTPTSSSSRCQA